MKKHIINLKVVENRTLNHEYNVLTLTADQVLPEMLPGQFVEMKVDGSPGVFLRRPFSIHDVDVEKNLVYILIQIIGEGSKKLAECKVGDSIDTIIPLGNSFSVPEKQEGRLLLVGGGCGIAPLLFHGKRLVKAGFKVSFLIGARSVNGILDIDKYKEVGEVYTTTEDGSHGEEGYVIHHSILHNNEPIDQIFTCGPEPMMKALVQYAKQNDIDCEASLENMMACGFGVCLCCVVDTIHGNICTCTDGPVFKKEILKW